MPNLKTVTIRTQKPQIWIWFLEPIF